MKLFRAILFFLLAFSATTAFGQNFVPGELLVKFAGGATPAKTSRATTRVGAAVLERFTDMGWIRVRLPKGTNLEDGMSQFSNLPEVEAVQPNFYYRLLATPNDPSYGSLWGMAKISAPAAWDLTTGSSTVVVADIDTGVRYTHQDLAANMWTNNVETPNNGIDDDGNGFIDDYYGWDFFYNDPDPMDENGHGTHTSGTIGAVGNNSVGVAGVNWNVKIMAIKIYSPQGTDTSSAMLINAYNYVLMMKNRGVNIRVTNNSYGGCAEACGYDRATKEAIDRLGAAGILNVFAAGNSNQNIDSIPFYPASYTSPSILVAASSVSDDTRSSFSSYGLVSTDIAAPGSSIYSTYNGSNSSYATLSGTSMATPHVAGAAALLSAYNPGLSAASLKATLMNTVDPLSNWSILVRSGGRLNVARALQNQTVCTAQFGSNTVVVPTKGGTVRISVTAPQNCDFAVTTNTSWAQPVNDTISGGGTVTVWVGVNRNVTRTTTINIGGYNVTITQNRGIPN